MKRKFILIAVVFVSLFGLKASAQYNPTVTIINNTICNATLRISTGGCGALKDETTNFNVASGTTYGPYDATAFSWTGGYTPNASTITWDQFYMMGVCLNVTFGQNMCPSGSVYSVPLCAVPCSAAIPPAIATASVSYSPAGDATVTIQ